MSEWACVWLLGTLLSWRGESLEHGSSFDVDHYVRSLPVDPSCTLSCSCVMDFRLELRFGKSTSTYYADAIRQAQQFSGFEPLSDDQRLNILRVGRDELQRKSDAFGALWEIVSRWKSSQILLNDEPLEGKDMYPITRVFACSRDYGKAVIQENHCKINSEKEGWGCKLMDTIGRYPPSNYYRDTTSWYQFGSFTSQHIWKLDKEKILSLLRRESELKHLALCPVFSFQRVEKIVNALPDEINLEDSETWEIRYAEHSDGVTLEKVPIGIAFKNGRGSQVGSGGLSLSYSLSAGKSDVSKKEPSTGRYIPEVTFDDIGGIDDIVETVREIVELPLKRPELFEYLGIKPHKGVLLHGPPGCGKTLIAKAIANDVGAHFVAVSGPELLSKWHGESEKNLRGIFEEARDHQPSTIFFDEIDSIAQKRSGDEIVRLDSRLVNQLLTLMDGIEEYKNVCVIASTNRVELLDDALLRPGRFDYSIEITKPTEDGCRTIFEIHTRDMPLASDFNPDSLTPMLFGLSGAEIAFVAREGAYNCLRRNLDLEDIIRSEEQKPINLEQFEITADDFRRALQKVG